MFRLWKHAYSFEMQSLVYDLRVQKSRYCINRQISRLCVPKNWLATYVCRRIATRNATYPNFIGLNSIEYVVLFFFCLWSSTKTHRGLFMVVVLFGIPPLYVGNIAARSDKEALTLIGCLRWMRYLLLLVPGFWYEDHVGIRLVRPNLDISWYSLIACSLTCFDMRL